jgi:isocitrate/isopropylmalate dehydrogenase
LRAAQTVTLIPGDGIGPDLTASVKEVVDALDVDFDWETAEAGRTVMMRKAQPYRSRCSSGSNAECRLVTRM